MAFPFVAAAFAVASTANSLLSTKANVKAERQAINHQIKVTQTERALREDDIRRAAARMAGRQRAIFAASGVELSGSVTDVLASTGGEMGREIYNLNLEAKNRISLLNYEKKVAKQRGRQQMVGSLLNFGSNMFSIGGFGGGGGGGGGLGGGNAPSGFSTNVDGLGWE